MDDRRVGAALRALRQRARLRQADVAANAGCHQTTVSRAERGHIDSLSIATLRRLFGALGARFDGDVRWRGGELDRLLDAEHARLVEAVAQQLREWGWAVLPEATFSEYGERGSIDVLASHAGTRVVAVLEMKRNVAAVDETIRRHDVKTRLAPKIALDRFGWRPEAVVSILVLPDTTASRSAIASHETTFASSYTSSSRAVRRWLRSPAKPSDGTRVVRGIWFLTLKHPGVGKRRGPTLHRVRKAAERGTGT